MDGNSLLALFIILFQIAKWGFILLIVFSQIYFIRATILDYSEAFSERDRRKNRKALAVTLITFPFVMAATLLFLPFMVLFTFIILHLMFKVYQELFDETSSLGY